MVAAVKKRSEKASGYAESLRAAPPCLTPFTDAYPDGHTAAAATGRFNPANRRGGHKSVESVKSADRSIPPFPISGIRKLRLGLRRRDLDQPADASGKVVQTFHYDSFGNALGFTPSSAITQYLYTQQYYDQFSSTYYDWARNYNTATGSFTQADYGNYGSLNDPMSMLPYAFTGGDPINLSDLNGHDFSVADIAVSSAINSAITAGLDVAGNVFLGQDKSFGEIVADSLLGGALGAIGGPIAGEFAGGIIERFGVYLARTGAAETAIRVIGEAVARGLFGATYTTIGVWTEYFLEHPNAPMGAKATIAVFLSSAVVSGLGSAVVEEHALAPFFRKALGSVQVGPEVQSMLDAVASGDFATAGELADNLSVQQFWQQAVPRLLDSDVAVGELSGSVLVAFADRVVDFLDGLALPGLQ